MLTVKIPDQELWDESTNEFYYIPGAVLDLEHSLVSVAKWEAKWHKAFISKKEKTNEELIDYIRCMTITKNVNQDIYYHIPNNIINRINEYIDNPMTATVIHDVQSNESSKDVPTSEMIYYWMLSNQVPVEFEKWHLNRLITLLRVCSVKNSPGKKLSRNEAYSRNAAINAANRKKFNTKG